MYKRLYLIALLVLYFTGVSSNDIRLGFTTSYSNKIYGEIKEESATLWKRTDDIIVDAPNNQIITAIFVTDLRENKDGEAFIESGGVGGKSVTIGLKSPSLLRGYKFEIEVFAEDPNAKYFNKGGDLSQTADTQFYRKN